ncbi:MAG: hypothetical protein LBC61_02510 [Candidatus Peribacteria bacterium]|jgi:hypothetical protein|nr:hypothetical protein [Candidatus Peribacteria bacterium]
MFQNGVSIFFQADLVEAQSLNSLTGIFKSERHLIISIQTAPVAQTIQILYIVYNFFKY